MVAKVKKKGTHVYVVNSSFVCIQTVSTRTRRGRVFLFGLRMTVTSYQCNSYGQMTIVLFFQVY